MWPGGTSARVQRCGIEILEMRSEHYIHPEFGVLAPTPRLRRELRIAFFPLLFGISVGVVAVSAMRAGDRSGDGRVASPAVAEGPAAAPNTQAPKVAEHSGAGSSWADARAGDPIAPGNGDLATKAKVGCDGDRFGCANGVARQPAAGGLAATNDRSAVASAPVDRPQPSTVVYPAGRPVDRKVDGGSATSDPTLDAGQNLTAPPRLPSARKARNTPQQTRPDLLPQRSNAKEDRSRIAADRTFGAEGDALAGAMRASAPHAASASGIGPPDLACRRGRSADGPRGAGG
jgi:hypothetical protein